MTWTVQKEIWIGLGDYVAGGSRSPPFIRSEGAIPRRPIVMGSMGISDGRDPYDSATMWADSGADGILISVDSADDVAAVAMIAQVTGIPIALSGDQTVVEGIASAINGTAMMLIGAGPVGGHVSVRGPGSDADMAYFDGLDTDGMYAYRLSGLKGDPGCMAPIVADLSGFAGGPMEEALAGYEAMLCGADVLMMGNPVSADMCRFMGEELGL